jgi:hypothetical protein
MTGNSLLTIAGIALAALLAAAPSAAQQKKTLAVVVKGLDNPFFTVLGDAAPSGTRTAPPPSAPASTRARPPAPTKRARCSSSRT